MTELGLHHDSEVSWMTLLELALEAKVADSEEFLSHKILGILKNAASCSSYRNFVEAFLNQLESVEENLKCLQLK